MSTNAAVGNKTTTGFRGRYVHWDGYPSAMIPALVAIIKRDGIEQAMRRMTREYTEWSTLSGDNADARPGEALVPGYGTTYPAEEQRDQWFTEKDKQGPCEWAYAITEIGIEVWRCLPTEQQWKRTPEHDVTFHEQVACPCGRSHPHRPYPAR